MLIYINGAHSSVALASVPSSEAIPGYFMSEAQQTLVTEENYLNLFSRGLGIHVFKINDTTVNALNSKRKLSQRQSRWRYSADCQMATKSPSVCWKVALGTFPTDSSPWGAAVQSVLRDGTRAAQLSQCRTNFCSTQIRTICHSWMLIMCSTYLEEKWSLAFKVQYSAQQQILVCCLIMACAFYGRGWPSLKRRCIFSITKSNRRYNIFLSTLQDERIHLK